MKTLRLSPFGLRGFTGDSLTMRAVLDYASAFASFAAGRRVLLARDTRGSSAMLAAAAGSALVAAGCEVLDLGICPAPILQFSVPANGAEGAILIGGGHLAAGWNSIQLVGPDGAPLDPLAGETVLDLYHAGAFARRGWDGLGRLQPAEAFLAPYLEALTRHLGVAAVRRAGFRVLLDPVGGAACPFLAPLTRALGVDAVAVNGEPSAYLARDPEPRPRNARPLAAMMRPLGAHAGFLFSSDASRVSLVTEEGEPVSEEMSLAIAADQALRRAQGPVVVNCCTSRMIDDLAAARGVPLIKTPVGQAHVMAGLADEDGVVGGEGSGSVAVPAFSRAFDGFLLMGLVLEAMAVSGRPLSALVGALRRYHIVKRTVRWSAGGSYRALDVLRERRPDVRDGRADETDGFRVDVADGWVHARASRTVPLVRIISESTDRAVAEARAEAWVRAIEEAS